MKVRENRLRRMAERQGLILEKSHRRDPRAKDFGLFRILADHRDYDDLVKTVSFSMSIDAVEEFLLGLEP